MALDEQSIHESLELLKEVRRDLTHDAQGCVRKKVDEAIDQLQQALNDESDKGISQRELLELIGQLARTVGPIANLIDTVIKALP